MAAGAKGRPSLMQTAAGLVLVLMALVIVYMYRVIDSMHQDQRTMRLQLAELTGAGYGSSPGRLAPPRPDFLPPPKRPTGAGAAGAALAGAALQEEEEGAGGATLMGLAAGPRGTPDPRKLSAMFTTGQTGGVGCYELSDAALAAHDVSSASGCNANTCPDCFVTPATLNQDVALTISGCSSAKWVRGQPRAGVWVYTFINTHATRALSVTDNSASPIVYNIPPSTHVYAFCASALGTTNKLYFPSTTLPTLTVDSAITLKAGNFDASASSGTFSTSSGAVTLNGDTTISNTKTFATGTGTVSLNGATTVAASTTFTVGTSGSGGATTLYGDLTVGSSTTGHSVNTVIYGDITQNDDGTTAKIFRSATGAVYLNGHTLVASGKNLMMVASGAGTFQTGTGAITLNGDVTITSSKKLATGTGTVSLNGATTVADSTTFTVGSSGAGGASTFYGAVNIGSSTTGHSVATTIYGDITQNDDGTTAKAFTTATGTITLNGHTTVASGKDLHMTATGAGTFQTGTGTVTLNGDTTISNVRTFTSGTGQVSLNGAVQLGNSVPFSVGSTGAGGNAQFFGDVYIGGPTATHSTALDVYGNVRFLDDASGAAKTFSTGTGAISLNGDVAVAKDRNLLMENTGNGQFSTATGTVNLDGNTLVKSGATFTIGTYANQLVCTHAYTDLGDTFCKASR